MRAVIIVLVILLIVIYAINQIPKSISVTINPSIAPPLDPIVKPQEEKIRQEVLQDFGEFVKNDGYVPLRDINGDLLYVPPTESIQYQPLSGPKVLSPDETYSPNIPPEKQTVQEPDKKYEDKP